MLLEDLFPPSFFTRQPPTRISTCPQWFLPVKMTGGQVSA